MTISSAFEPTAHGRYCAICRTGQRASNRLICVQIQQCPYRSAIDKHKTQKSPNKIEN